MKDQEYDYFYEDEQDAKYCYPGINVLKNKLDIRDLDTLHEAERDYSAVRQAELVGQGVTGDFSFKHLCSIHRHLFSDVYSWAGKTRTVDIFKNNLLCFVICPTDMAFNLVFTEILSFIREWLGRFITFLNFKLRKIN